MQKSATDVGVLVVDADAMVRDNVGHLVNGMAGFNVCGSVSPTPSTIELTARLAPSVVVIDPFHPPGFPLFQDLRAASPTLELVIFSDFFSETLIHRTLAAGARSCVLKTEPMSELATALHHAAHHRPYYTAGVLAIVIHADPYPHSPSPVSALSRLDRQILRLTGDGHSHENIADLVDVSASTVAAQQAALMVQFQLSTVDQVKRFVLRNALAV